MFCPYCGEKILASKSGSEKEPSNSSGNNSGGSSSGGSGYASSGYNGGSGYVSSGYSGGSGYASSGYNGGSGYAGSGYNGGSGDSGYGGSGSSSSGTNSSGYNGGSGYAGSGYSSGGSSESGYSGSGYSSGGSGESGYSGSGYNSESGYGFGGGPDISNSSFEKRTDPPKLRGTGTVERMIHLGSGLVGFAPLIGMFFSLLGGGKDLEEDILPEKQNLYYIMMDLLAASLFALSYTNDVFTGYVFIEINTIAACSIVMAKDCGQTGP